MGPSINRHQIATDNAQNSAKLQQHISRHQTFDIIAVFVRKDIQNSPPEKPSLNLNLNRNTPLTWLWQEMHLWACFLIPECFYRKSSNEGFTRCRPWGLEAATVTLLQSTAVTLAAHWLLMFYQQEHNTKVLHSPNTKNVSCPIELQSICSTGHIF